MASPTKATTVTAFKGSFDGDSENAQKEFRCLHSVVTGLYPKFAKGRENLALLNTISDKLEAISNPDPTDKDPERRKLKPAAQTILFDQKEYNKVKTMVTDDDFGWSFQVRNDAQRMIKWVEDMEEVTCSQEVVKKAEFDSTAVLTLTKES